MIIIAENKKSHYLIKKFLIESGIEQEHKDVQFGLTPVQDQDPRQYVQTDLTPVGSKKVYTAKEEIEEENRVKVEKAKAREAAILANLK